MLLGGACDAQGVQAVWIARGLLRCGGKEDMVPKQLVLHTVVHCCPDGGQVPVLLRWHRSCQFMPGMSVERPDQARAGLNNLHGAGIGALLLRCGQLRWTGGPLPT